MDGLMGFEDEMYEFVDELKERKMNRSYFLFKENTITCVGVPFRTLFWNYICWLLAGKPKMKEQEI
tara:strand:- start:131 stop:328 length:198 start_codon:yes stop_codon:yes gene_type:complete